MRAGCRRTNTAGCRSLRVDQARASASEGKLMLIHLEATLEEREKLKRG
jgi:hypothetical protein